MTKNKIVSFAIGLAVAAGFVWNLNILQGISQTLVNLEKELQSFRSLVIAMDGTEPVPVKALESMTPDETSAGDAIENKPAVTTTDIPTSIIFTAVSSPLLLPQSALTVTLEKASLSTSDQTATLHLKIFTNESEAFNALEPTSIFALFDEQTGELKPPTALYGPFNQLPPRSAVAGRIIFQIDPNRNIFIFKIGGGNETKFYEFDFNKKTYQETTVG